MLMTKHENRTFENQTIYVSGQAFVGCNFVGCTLVLRETMYHVEGCTFDRCNWHVDCLVLWGSERAVDVLRQLVSLLDQGLEKLKAVQAQDPSAQTAGDATATPFA